MPQHVAIYARTTATTPELVHALQQAVEDRGAIVLAVYLDDGNVAGRGKYAAWKRLLGHIDIVDQVVLSNAGDIPGRTVADLLKILSLFRDQSISLYLHDEQIDTGSTTFALLDIIIAYRKAKLSQAIRKGQEKAVAAGKKVGRPIVPNRVQDRIRDALAQGGGIRPTARRFSVSPASVINIRRAMTISTCT